MFIGEAPGADEDRLGRPFVGAAGQLLDALPAPVPRHADLVHGLAVDDERARAADAFAAIVVEGNGLLAAIGELFVDHVEHLEERHVRIEILRLVLDELARLLDQIGK